MELSIRCFTVEDTTYIIAQVFRHHCSYVCGGRTDVGSHHDIVQTKQLGMNLGFTLKNVQPGGEQVTIFQGLDQRGLVHDLPPGRIDQHSTRLHEANPGPIEKPSCLRCQWHVHREDVRGLEQFLQVTIRR